MAGEILKSKTLEEAKEELRTIYKRTASSLTESSKEEYDTLTQDEREDSDNHLNEEKLGKEADVIDLAFYKFLANRKTAYKIILKHKNGNQMEDYFIIIPEMNKA